MRIPCPWCGPRPLDEFEYGGDAGKKRPAGRRQTNHDAWMDYVYYRDNPAGTHREYWQHVSGCRAWLVVTRDTTTHAIGKAVLARPQHARAKK